MRDPETGQMVDPNQIGEGPLSEEQLIYKDNILDYYKHPRNKRAIERALRHQELNPLCGDRVEIFLLIEDGRIVDAAFEGKGCAISQASASMLTEKLQGMSVADVAKLSREDVLEMLGIPIGVVRMKCAMLGLRTTQRALVNA